MMNKRTQNKLKTAAKKVIKSLEKNVGWYTTEKPIILEGEDGQVIISWECGPSEWTLNDGYGLFEETVYDLQALGLNPVYKEKRMFDVPKGFYCEPQNSYQVSIWED